MNSENNLSSYDKGLQYLNDKQFNEAVEEFEKAVIEQPEDSSTWNYLGYCFYQLQRYSEAVEKFAKAEKLGLNSDFIFYTNWADSLSRQGSFKEAIKKIKTAYKINPESPIVLETWGSIYYDHKQDIKALEKYKQAVLLDENFDTSFYNIGLSYFNLAKFEEAKKYLEKATGLAPEIDYYHLLLADTFLYLREYKSALKEYQKALECGTPETELLYFNWGYSLFYVEDYDEALKMFELSEKLQPNNGNIYLHRGLILEKKGKLEEAAYEYDKSMNFEDVFAFAAFAKGTLKFYQGHYEEALKLFDQCTDKDSQFAAAIYNRAATLWQVGKYSDGWKDWEQLKYIYDTLEFQGKLDNQPEQCSDYGKVLHLAFGEFSDAEKMFTKAQKFLSDSNFSLDLLSLYLEFKNTHLENENKYHWKSQQIFKQLVNSLEKEQEGLKGEITDLQRQIFVAENSEDDEQKISELNEHKLFVEQKLLQSLYSLGTVYFEMEDFESALKWVSQVNEVIKNSELENSPAVQNTIGICCSNLGKHSEAIMYLKSALEETFDDFLFRTNLANAYLRAFYDTNSETVKSKYLEIAELEFRKVLREAPGNIDAHIGLGNVQLELSEFGNQDLFEDVIENYTQALDLAKFRKGSRRLTDKEKAAVFYSRGFVAIRLFSKSNSLNRRKWLRSAYRDFQTASEMDCTHLSAKRAFETLNQRLSYLNSETFLEKVSPILIGILAIIIFGFSVYSYFFNQPKEIPIGYFIILVFGSLLFLIAGLSMPLLLKLKVGTIELEKAIRDNIPQKEDFGMIKKQPWKNIFSQTRLFTTPSKKANNTSDRQGKSDTPDEKQ